MFGFGKKKEKSFGLNDVYHDEKAILTLIATLKFMITYPDAYVNEYAFYKEEIYTHTTMDIIIGLRSKYEKSLLSQKKNFSYSDEELFVLWTIINIMTQVPESKESIDVYSQLMGVLAESTMLAEKRYS